MERLDLDFEPERSLLADVLPTAAYVLQADRFVFVNTAAADLLGRDSAELQRVKWWEVADPSIQAAIRERVRGWLEGRPVEFHGVKPIVTARGERRWIEVFRRRIDFRGAPALLVSGIDLTERLAWLESARKRIEQFDAPAGRLRGGPLGEGERLPQPALPEPRRAAPDDAIARLTRRQRQVLDLVARGRSNKQIALDLGITEGTAKLHVFSLMRLLKAGNRTMLALIAHAVGQDGGR